MTTLQAIDTIGSYKLGGIYTEESAANTQLKLLSLLNTARSRVLRDLYISLRIIPQVCYQSFEIEPMWEDDDLCSFVAIIPQIMTFPPPQMNGWDAVMPKSGCAFGLTEIESEQQLRAYRNHPLLKAYHTGGWYITTGNQMKGLLAPKVKTDGLTGRAVLSNPHLLPNFNVDVDEYPLPEDMFSDIKKVLESDEGRRWFRVILDQKSNSQVDADSTTTSGR